MNKMRRKTILYIVIVVLIFVVGYSAIYNINLKKELLENEAYDFLEGKTIVRVWLPKDKLASTRGYQAEKFNEQHDDMYLMLGLYDTNDYSNILKTAVAAEKGPDIMMYNGFNLMRNESIKNLDDIDFDKADMKQGDYVQYNGFNIGVRMAETTAKLVWNKEIFEKAGLDPDKPPKTWDELVEYSRIIKSKLPNVTPFQFPIKDYEDFRVSIGEPCVNNDTIYTSFWDYNEGKYDYDSAKDILKIYNTLYTEGLLDEEFFKKSRNNLRMDFYEDNVAMHLSTFEDKGYFSNIVPLQFEIGISELPKFNIEDTDKKYFISNANFLTINSTFDEKTEEEQEAIIEVFNWMISEQVNREILQTRSEISPTIDNTKVPNDIYTEYNNVKNFKTEYLDPSIFMSRSSQGTIDSAIDAIMGNKTIEEVVQELNQVYEKNVEFTQENRKINLEYYKE
ncbi:MAG: ABC transporter substrate-binding protein [Clostridium sp.]